jgi:hypothetical protein
VSCHRLRAAGIDALPCWRNSWNWNYLFPCRNNIYSVCGASIKNKGNRKKRKETEEKGKRIEERKRKEKEAKRKKRKFFA